MTALKNSPWKKVSLSRTPSSFRKCSAMSRCPVEETGRNSVMPSMSPRRIAMSRMDISFPVSRNVARRVPPPV
jgi:hypothetical protein